MTYIDIEGIVEDSQKRVNLRKKQKHKLFTHSLSSRIFKSFAVILFLGASFFIFSQIFSQLSEFKQDIVIASSKVNNNKITEKINFKTFTDIEPAAGDNLDDLLNWDSAPKQQESPAVVNKSNVAENPVRPQLNNKVENVRNTVRAEDNKKLETAVNTKSEIASDELKEMKRAFDELSNKVDSYRKVMAENNDRLRTFNNNFNALNQRITHVEDYINSLNDKIITLEEAAKVKEEEAKIKEAAAKIKEEELKSKLNSKISSLATSNNKKASVRKNDNIWVLKSARQGVAWVSYKGRDNLTSISVGEELEGLGKVLEIGKNSSGKWFVKCEKGTVNQ